MNPKINKEIIRVLKVEYLAKPIANTNKGLLALVIRNDQSEPYLVLDAVPLEKEKSDYLIKLLYEDISSFKGGDVERTQKDYPRVKEEGIKVGSSETSEGIKGDKEEVI